MALDDRDDPDRTAPLPAAAAWLGYGGLLPFAAGAAGAWLASGFAQAAIGAALLCYGGAILSFLGGIHWGWGAQVGADRVAARLGWSVLPSLWAAAAMTAGLLTGPRVGYGALVAGLLLWRLLEAAVCPPGPVAPWYPRLRRHLTFGASACLVLAALAPQSA